MRRELCTCSSPLYSIKPSFLNLLRKKLTRDRVVPTPLVPEWELIATRIFDYGEQAIRGGVPADTVLARLDDEVNRILERRRWLLARAAGGR